MKGSTALFVLACLFAAMQLFEYIYWIIKPSIHPQEYTIQVAIYFSAFVIVYQLEKIYKKI